MTRQGGIQAIAGRGPTKDAAPLFPPSIRHVHWIFLVHGWMGNPAELNALRASLVDTAQAWISMAEHDNDDDTTAVVVHCNQANDGQTSDGIVAGGTRIATEMQAWLEWTQTQQLPYAIIKNTLLHPSVELIVNDQSQVKLVEELTNKKVKYVMNNWDVNVLRQIADE